MKSGSNESQKCSLHDVLYVPELLYNLISVSKAAERGNSVKFSDFGCIVRDNKQKVVGLMATAQGFVRLRMKSGSNESQKCSVHDVLYVPELLYNLISVSKAAERGNSVKLSDFGCIVRDNKQKVVGIGTRQGGLYQVHIVDGEYAHMTCTPVLYRQFSKEDVWHHRFGHLSMKNPQKLAREKMVSEFNYSEKMEIQFCESCLEGKLTRKPFPHHSLNRVRETLELVHTDVCGKVNAKSLSGSEYFLTFVDDHTR